MTDRHDWPWMVAQADVIAENNRAKSAASLAADISDLIPEDDGLGLTMNINDDTARMDWIIDNCTIKGGGNGFTFCVFVPCDVEDIRTAIDMTIANKESYVIEPCFAPKCDMCGLNDKVTGSDGPFSSEWHCSRCDEAWAEPF